MGWPHSLACADDRQQPGSRHACHNMAAAKPRVALAATDNPEPSAVSHPHTGLVLLVDDEAPIRATIAEMLEEVGLQVRQADSPENALSLVMGGLKPDYLVTDHLMPVMTGVELAPRDYRHCFRSARPDHFGLCRSRNARRFVVPSRQTLCSGRSDACTGGTVGTARIVGVIPSVKALWACVPIISIAQKCGNGETNRVRPLSETLIILACLEGCALLSVGTRNLSSLTRSLCAPAHSWKPLLNQQIGRLRRNQFSLKARERTDRARSASDIPAPSRSHGLCRDGPKHSATMAQKRPAHKPPRYRACAPQNRP